MTDPTDPRQPAYDPDSLVWPEMVDNGPTDPRLYAWVLENHGRDRADWTPAPDLSAPPFPEYGYDAPDHVLMARAIARLPRSQPPGSAESSTDAAPMATGASEAVSALQPASIGALSAEEAASPAAALVPTDRSGGQAAKAPALASPTSQGGYGLPLRSELSSGPDPLVAAMSGPHPNDNPFGFFVDPKTGSVSRLRLGVGGSPLNPNGPALEPVGPQEKQSYLEWLSGARANYSLGAISPQEHAARNQLQIGALPGATGQPISAAASGKTVTYRLPDGRTYALTGEHPNRDQNPRNIKAGDFANRHGAIGQDGKFAIFPTNEQAYQASMALMSSMAGNGKEWPGYPAGSLANIVRQWSPASDNNKTEDMINDIMTMTGLDRRAKFESLTPSQKDAFVHAYARREGYSPIAPDLPAAVR